MGTMRKLRRKACTARHRVQPLVPEQFTSVRKMSEVLLDFAEPLLDTLDDDDDFKAAISFAALCWNCSLLPPKEQGQQLSAMVDGLGKSDALMRLEVEDKICMLLERKRTSFASDNRMVVSFEVVQDQGRPRLLVVSAFVKDSQPANP